MANIHAEEAREKPDVASKVPVRDSLSLLRGHILRYRMKKALAEGRIG